MAGSFPLAIPIQLRRRGVEAKLVIAGARGRSMVPDPGLIAIIADAHHWIEELVV